MKLLTALLATIVLATAGCTTADKQDDGWVSLFNGKDLEGWIVKTKGSAAGENPWNLFRVEDGTLAVSYAEFDQTFKDEFGHIHTAGNPGRGELDDKQEINFAGVMHKLLELGYSGAVGHEFIPTRDPYAGLQEAISACDV